MGEVPRSINAYIGWHQVLPLLEVDAAVGPFPMLVRCPLCNNRQLHIYDDTKFGGNWHYCPDCKSSGDMIELAARYWKCNPYTAIMRMTDNGVAFPPESLSREAITKYEKKHIAGRAKHQKLIEDACAALTTGTANVWGVINQLGISQEHHKATWANRMGKFVGAAERRRVSNAFHSYAGASEKGGWRIFKGIGWKDVLVIPFRDLPGRCCGFLFIGRFGRKKDYVYKTITSSSHWSPQLENGLCMYETVLGRTARRDWFKDDVFVITDPIAALRLQSRHMRESELPLPIVGTYSAPITSDRHKYSLVTHTTWNNIPGKDFVFWGSHLEANLFNMASRCNGRIWISEELAHLGQTSSPVWLRKAQRKARHWAEVLETTLRTLPEEEAGRLLGELNLQAAVLRQFIDNCGIAARERIESFQKKLGSSNTIKIKSCEVTESEAGWIIQKTGEAVSDAILRIEKIICRPDAEDAEPYCQGRIICGNDIFEFTERLEVIEKNAAKWLRRAALNNLGKLITVKQSWSQSLIDLAKHFYRPLVIREDGQFGWKPHDSCFSLPKFSATIGEDISADAVSFIGKWSPGRDLHPPETPPQAISSLLQDTPANRIFWATMACLGANILAPAAGQPVAGIGLMGRGSVLVGKEVARAAGCCEYVFAGYGAARAANNVNELDQILCTHKWPIWLATGPDTHKAAFSMWINSHQQQNVIQPLDLPRADILAMLEPWRFVVDATAVEPSPTIKMYGPLLIPLWLQRLCQQKLQLESNAEAFIHRVLDDFAAMLSEYGSTDVIDSAADIIDDAIDDQAYHFVKILHGLVSDNLIQFQRADGGGHPNAAAIYRVDDGERAPGIFVSRDTLTRGLFKLGVSMPDPGRITNALRSANALDCECRYNDSVGWFIIERWWDRQLRRCCEHQQRRFKIIGGVR